MFSRHRQFHHARTSTTLGIYWAWVPVRDRDAADHLLLGLPVGRLRNVSVAGRTFLNAVAVGILVFLLFDVLAHVNEPLETSLKVAPSGEGSWGSFVWLASVAVVGFGVGLLSLVYLERRALRRGSASADSIDELDESVVGDARPGAGRSSRPDRRPQRPRPLSWRSSSPRASGCTTSPKASRSASPRSRTTSP